ncbi:hypothetical protein BH09CHL1_BH09CHL1_16960 [soil metagenome]
MAFGPGVATPGYARKHVSDVDCNWHGVRKIISRHSAFGIRHSAFGIRHSAFGIRHSAFGIRHSAFGIRHSVKAINTYVASLPRRRCRLRARGRLSELVRIGSAETLGWRVLSDEPIPLVIAVPGVVDRGCDLYVARTRWLLLPRLGMKRHCLMSIEVRLRKTIRQSPSLPDRFPRPRSSPEGSVRCTQRIGPGGLSAHP